LKTVQKDFVGFTKNGKLSLPKGVDSKNNTDGLIWLGKLISLYLIHQRQTKNGQTIGREGRSEQASAGVSQASAGVSDKGSKVAVSEGNSDQNPFHFGKWIAIIEALLDKANDPVVFTLQQRTLQSTDIIYSQLSRYLHQAIYADDDVIMLAEMPQNKMRGSYETSDLIGMLYWLALDVTETLTINIDDWGYVPNHIIGLAHEFADQYLSQNASLFNDEKDKTLDDLRSAFEIISRRHPRVDSETEDVIDVIENYLYAGHKNTDHKLDEASEDKIDNALLGSNFYDIWEMLCIHHAYRTYIRPDNQNDQNKWEVLIADGGNVPLSWHKRDIFKDKLVFKDEPAHEGLRNYFGNSRPDLILYKNNANFEYKIIDFKYYKDVGQMLEKSGISCNGQDTNKGNNESKNDAFGKSIDYLASALHYHYSEHKAVKAVATVEFWYPSDKDYQTNFVGKFLGINIENMINVFLENPPNKMRVLHEPQ